MRRYVLLQLPGWSLAALLVIGFSHMDWLTARTAVALFLLWMAKDFILYPLVRQAYLPSDETAAGRLIGKRAVVRFALNPRGYVEIAGELWRAELARGEAQVPVGDRVTILAVQGLNLVVTHDIRQTRDSSPGLWSSPITLGPAGQARDRHLSSWRR